MRTSLNETKALEEWLLQTGKTSERLLIEARVLTNPDLHEKAIWQHRTYELAREFGREKLLHEIKTVEQQLFFLPKYRSFQDRIRSIFKR